MGKRSNGEGTIFKRKDGRWCGAYFDEQFNRHFVYGKTQAETKRKLKEKQEGRTIKGKPYLFQEWILEFLQNYKKNELKVTTYDSYMLRYRKHILNTQLGMTKLENVRAANLQCTFRINGAPFPRQRCKRLAPTVRYPFVVTC